MSSTDPNSPESLTDPVQSPVPEADASSVVAEDHDTPAAGGRKAARETVWKVATGVLTVATLAVGAWALSLNGQVSDLDSEVSSLTDQLSSPSPTQS